MARVLFLTELLPYPLVSGAKIRAYYVLRHLATRHQVTLLSFVRPDDREEYLDHLKGLVHQVHTVPVQRSLPRNLRAMLVSLLTGRPAIIAREEIGAMHRRVTRFLTSRLFDLVHADQIPMAQYGLLGSGIQIRRVLDQHNATFRILERLAQYETNPMKRLFMMREARAFAGYEVQVCRQFDHVTFVTREDQQALSNQMGDAAPELMESSTVIPICVDTEEVATIPPVAVPFRVTHVGTMYWPPNIEGLLWFCHDVWSRIIEQVPEARLTLIGKDPPDSVQALCSRPGIEVLGYVKDLTPFLAETAAFIVPLHAAGGMRVKIPNAWCWGVPIVSTSVGAEGIAYRDGENILVDDTPAGFARTVVRLLRDGQLRENLRSNGRRWVETHYEWRRVYSAWDEVYDGLDQS